MRPQHIDMGIRMRRSRRGDINWRTNFLHNLNLHLLQLDLLPIIMYKLVVVVGATGRQGGGVVNAFLEDCTFKVRGITRNPDSKRSQELAAKGVDMVQADLNDEVSLDRAFTGAHAIFAVTDYYEHFFPYGKDVAIETETRYGINMAKAAAKISGLERYLWSTLPLTSALSKGKIVTPHFESMGRVDAYIKEHLPALFQETTFCIWSFFEPRSHV